MQVKTDKTEYHLRDEAMYSVVVGDDVIGQRHGDVMNT